MNDYSSTIKLNSGETIEVAAKYTTIRRHITEGASHVEVTTNDGKRSYVSVNSIAAVQEQ